jgi:protein arginine kinase
MKFAQVMSSAGEWLRGEGPHHQVVVSSRVRLARNLRHRSFPGWAKKAERTQILEQIKPQVEELAEMQDSFSELLQDLSPLEKQVLVERHLISREHAAKGIGSAVTMNRKQTLSIMINEEDHLRMQSIRSGLQLKNAFKLVDKIDSTLESKLDIAYDPHLGYLTACPTNVGTGIRVSVMLHLPALKLTGEIDKVFRAAKEMKLAVRGLYGEGTEATGDFFQISNQSTLGKTEEDIIDDFKRVVIPQIITYEHNARKHLMSDRSVALDDKVSRALGLLRSARLMATDETLLLLSHLRMGVHLGRVKDVDLRTINELFLLTQPAHLQKIQGKKMEGDVRRAARADYIRARLNGH